MTESQSNAETRVAATDIFRPTRDFWIIYICLMLVMFLAAMDQTIVATALPTIVGKLGGVEHMAWIITAYTLAVTVAMPVYGKLGDVIGRKEMYLAAIAIFLIGSALCGYASSMEQLIIFRALQGLGGGGLMISSQAITGDLIPPRVRATYMAPMGAVWGIAAVLGPVVGGWLTDSITWRWVFWINLPIGVVAWLLCARSLHLPRHVRTQPIDWWGMIVLNGGAIAFVLVATWGGTQWAWTSPQIIALGCAGLLLWSVVPLISRRAADPVLPMGVLTNRTFIVSTIVGMLGVGALFGMNGYLPTYVQMVYGYSATVSGLLLVPGAIAMLLASTVSGHLVTVTGRYRIFPIVGPMIAAGGMLLLSQMSVDTPIWMLCLNVFILNFGTGLYFQLLILVVQNALPARQLGTATASTNFFRQIGVSLFAALIGVAFSSRLSSGLAGLQGAGAGSLDPDHLTPTLVSSLPEPLHGDVVSTYSDALTPVMGMVVPVMILAAIIAVAFPRLELGTRDGLTQRAREEVGLDGAAAEARQDESVLS